MITNLNARLTGNSGVFVQYQQEGKAKDAVFVDWTTFIGWLSGELARELSERTL